MLAVGFYRLVHLDREFASWRQHQHPYRVARGRRTRAGEGKNTLQQRQRESGRFAGTRLCPTHQVATRKNDRYRLCLDRRWLGVALVGKGSQEIRRQAEFIKTHPRNL
jgi:hypothetical protein